MSLVGARSITEKTCWSLWGKKRVYAGAGRVSEPDLQDSCKLNTLTATAYEPYASFSKLYAKTILQEALLEW